MIQVYHNNRCSKSREALQLLEEKGQQLQVIDYLKNAPTADELRSLVQKLGIKPEQLLRKNETIFKAQFAGETYTDDEWLQIMAENPILIERPIVVNGDKAVIGRPPENVLAIL
ncbi:arsenate reductase (glutaredoxin) [Pontibacter liquoris]|uniref:arsenate reductase (glutaredoxin) n=1 Tax=Pontibacter liquoris TaxID=2905677 RepID=UPI001FA6EA91|nr:arsenate reductase (glutaredoxin) [Pontibacter liquoris]